MTVLWVLLPASVFMSAGLTWLVRRYAVRRRILDIPNARSSHVEATPSGGGAAIAMTYLGCLGVLFAVDLVSIRELALYAGGSGIVATIGFLDDSGDIHAGIRLIVHLAAAIWVLAILEGTLAVSFREYWSAPVWLLNVGAAIFLVWMLNLYNFMDGIDGIASLEAITVCAAIVAIHLICGVENAAWITPALLCGSVSGFIFWNYPPARIFMGDSGSGFIGFSLGILALTDLSVRPQFFWSWLILLGAFIVDASITLIRRLLQRDKIYIAHRSHAYQHASRRFESHKIVTNAVGAINLVWLFPWALAVANGVVDGAIGLLAAYLPLFVLAIYFQAGVRGN